VFGVATAKSSGDWQNSDPRFGLIYRDKRAAFQKRAMPFKHGDDGLPKERRRNVLCANLNNARALRFGVRQQDAEIEVMRKNDGALIHEPIA